MTCREFEEELNRELKKLTIKKMLTRSEAERRSIAARIREAAGELEFLQSIGSRRKNSKGYEVR